MSTFDERPADLPTPARTLVSSAGVDHESARLWFRVEHPEGEYRVRLHACDEREALSEFDLRAGTRFGDDACVVRYPQDVAGAQPLAPESGYRYVLSSRDAVVAEGEFETAPAPGQPAREPFSLAVMSCHQPFREDASVDPSSLRMLDALPEVLEAERVKRVLMIGDQMYTDYPQRYSLFDREYFRKVGPASREGILDCSAEQVRELLHERYRHSWGVAQFDRIQRSWPTYMIPDDHEFVDNWGSAPEHSGPRWREFGQGAIAACHDYEMSRVTDDATPPYHFELEYGEVATFVMDLRSEKRTDDEVSELYSASQYAALERFFARHRAARTPVVMLACSVPLFHLPDWMGRLGTKLLAEGSDVHDRWSAPKARKARDGIVRLLKEHKRACPDQQLILLGGDVHVSLAAELRWADVPAPAYQLTASPMSNGDGGVMAGFAALLGRAKDHLEREDAGGVSDIDLLPGVSGYGHNPYARLNVGIVSFEPRVSGLEVTLKLYTFDRDRPGRGKLVYCSEPIVATRAAARAAASGAGASVGQGALAAAARGR